MFTKLFLQDLRLYAPEMHLRSLTVIGRQRTVIFRLNGRRRFNMISYEAINR